MVWNPKWDLNFYCCLFCDKNMAKVRDYATLHLYKTIKDDNYHNTEDLVYNGPYIDKSKFLNHIIFCGVGGDKNNL